MRKKLLVMAGILAVSMSASTAAWAEAMTEEIPARAVDESSEDNGILDYLFGEDGIAAGLLPEEADIEAMLETVDEQVGTVESQARQVIDDIKEELESEYGSFNLEEILEGYAGGLISSILGGGEDFDFGNLDAMIEHYNMLRDQMTDYIKDENAQNLVQGDAQIVAITIANDPDIDADEFKYLVEADQSDFEADGTSLCFVGGASVPVLFTFRKAEDGSDMIVDVKMPEDGEGYADSLKEMCAEADYPFEDMLVTIEAGKIWILDEMAEYLKEHPEYEQIELDGEMKTADELEDLWIERLGALYGEGENETEELPEMEEGTEAVEP